MSLFSEFDLFRRSVHDLFSDFERDFLNDRYLLGTHFYQHPLIQQQLLSSQDDGMDIDRSLSKPDANNKSSNNNNTQLQQSNRGGGALTNRNLWSALNPWAPTSLSRSCKMDVIEKNDRYEIHAELPGIPKENIKVDVSDGVLTLSGEHKMMKESKSPNTDNATDNKENKDNKDNKDEPQYHYRERSYSSIKRSLRLPESIDSEKISANYDNGVLEIFLPKKEKVIPKTMNIQIA